MHAGSLQSRRLTSSDGNRTASRAHPLGNIDQFHGLRAAPKVLGLLDTKPLLLGSTISRFAGRRLRQSGADVDVPRALRRAQALGERRWDENNDGDAEDAGENDWERG